MLEEPTKEDALVTRALRVKATAPPGNWQNRLREPVVPLPKIKSAVLRRLAARRDPGSYVAGATPLNRNTVRYSDDIDRFHDREEQAPGEVGDN